MLELFERKFYEQVIEELKEKIVIAYLKYNQGITKTLRPAVVALTKAEFPRNWSGLTASLVKFAA